MGMVTKLLVGLILISMAFTGITMFLGDMMSNYDVTMSGNYTNVYSRINSSVYNSTSDISLINTELTEGTNETVSGELVSTAGWTDLLWNSGITTVKNIFGSAGVATGMVSAVTDTVPGLGQGWITSGLFMIISIVVVLIILGIIIRRTL